MDFQDKQEIINSEVKELLKGHDARLEVANHEMGEVKTHLGSISTDIGWLKAGLEKLDSKIWWILTSVVMGIGAQILVTLLKK